MSADLMHYAIERQKYLRAMVAHYRVRVEMYKVMVSEWEEELRKKPFSPDMTKGNEPTEKPS
jgi:hypothetical protein